MPCCRAGRAHSFGRHWYALQAKPVHASLFGGTCPAPGAIRTGQAITAYTIRMAGTGPVAPAPLANSPRRCSVGQCRVSGKSPVCRRCGASEPPSKSVDGSAALRSVCCGRSLQRRVRGLPTKMTAAATCWCPDVSPVTGFGRIRSDAQQRVQMPDRTAQANFNGSAGR